MLILLDITGFCQSRFLSPNNLLSHVSVAGVPGPILTFCLSCFCVFSTLPLAGSTEAPAKGEGSPASGWKSVLIFLQKHPAPKWLYGIVIYAI